MKTFLDILSATGRLVYYGKGLCRCVKEVTIIYINFANNTSRPFWSLITKDKNEL